MIKVLVCGSKGQLGSSIRVCSGEFREMQFRYTDIEELDILDPVAVKLLTAEFKPDYIINCAAYTMVDKAESDPEKAFLLNAEAVKNLHSAAGLCGARLIQVSTDYVFNGRNHRPYNENDITVPDSVYGISKLKGESYLSGSGIAIVIRTSWLYSEFGHNFLKTVLRLGNEGKEIHMVFDQIGTPTYACDLAMTILKIIKLANSNHSAFIPGVYHFSNEGVASWYDFAMEIAAMSGLETSIYPILTSDYPLPAPRPPYSVLNKKKIRDTFGIEIRHWKYALKDCLKKMEGSGLNESWK